MSQLPLTQDKIDNMTSNAPTWEQLIDVSEVLCITGMKRHGKSVLTYYLTDYLAEFYEKPKFAWGIPYQKHDHFPENLTHFSELEMIRSMTNGVIGIDEIHRNFNARESMSKKNIIFSDVMTFSGQNNQILILSTLNLGLIDVNTFRIANPILLYKRVGNLQAASERHNLRQYTIKAQQEWDKIPKGRKNTVDRNLENQLTYAISDSYIGWIKNPQPEWWSQSTSEMHSGLENNMIELIDGRLRPEYAIFIHSKLKGIPKEKKFEEFKRIKEIYPYERYIKEKGKKILI